MELNINPSEALLIACANPDAAPGILAPYLSKEIDWESFIESAHSHRLLPLLHKHISSHKSLVFPDLLIKAALQAYTANSVRMEFMASQLARIRRQICAAQLRAVTWKGPDLAQNVYGDMALRPADDLDFLVHPDDMTRAIELCASLGLKPKLPMTISTRSYYIKAGYEFIMVSWEGDLTVELASRPVPPPAPLDASPAEIWDSDAGNLTPERYFLYLCMHGARHCWERLIWVSDICAFLSAHPDLDLDKLIKMARDVRAEVMVLSAFDMAECVGRTVPHTRGLGSKLPKEYLINNALHSEHSTIAEERIRVAMYSCRTDKIRHCIRWLLAPTFSDWEVISLPAGLRWIYWLLRPFRLAFSRLRR